MRYTKACRAGSISLCPDQGPFEVASIGLVSHGQHLDPVLGRDAKCPFKQRRGDTHPTRAMPIGCKDFQLAQASRECVWGCIV